MMYPLLAVNTEDIIALAFAVLSLLFVIFIIVYGFLTKVGKTEVDRVHEGKCPLSGKSLNIKILKEERETRKKYAGYNSELVFRKAEDGTIRGGIENTRLYSDQKIGGVLQERWTDFNSDYSLIFTQTTRIDTRKNPYADRVEDEEIEYITEVYTYEVESFGKLGKLDKIRLKKACKKASFVNKFDA